MPSFLPYLSLRARIQLVSITIGAALLVVALIGHRSLDRFAAAARAGLATTSAEVMLASKFAATVRDEIVAAEAYFVAGDSVAWHASQRYGEEAHAIHRQMTRSVTPTAEAAALIARTDRALSLVESSFARADALRRLGDPGAADQELVRAQPALRAIHTQLDSLSAARERWLHGLATELTREASAESRALIAAAAVAALVAFAVSGTLTRSIVRPLGTLVAHAERLRDGELKTRTSLVALPGELQVLAEAMNRAGDALARREQELFRTQQELVHTARQAGMAEVATGVLHNVGNVLNSVTVSATLMADRLRRSSVPNLARAATLLAEQPDAAAFLATDPRGRVLPQYLERATSTLAQEHETFLAEMASVVKNVDHIAEIIARQQRYAGVHELLEPVALPVLLDDALAIEQPAFRRHAIDVIREYGADATVETDKHAVMQILVNLVVNARHALRETDVPARRLVARIEDTPDEVRVSIVDNGCGIRTEHLERLFTHGFTTRPDGHGFGLHASALSAKQLGARLTGHSDGPDLGATFTLALPRRRVAAAAVAV